MQPNRFQVMDAALLPASKVFQVWSIIISKQQWMQAFMQSKLMQLLEAEKTLPVLDAASLSATKVFQATAISFEGLKKVLK